jgi:hypothetical protein
MSEDSKRIDPPLEHGGGSRQGEDPGSKTPGF